MRPLFPDTAGEYPDTGRIYLNNASVSRMPASSVRAMEDFLLEYNRAGPDSRAAAGLVEEVAHRIRKTISGMVRCQPDEIALTQSTTDGINAVAAGLAVKPNANMVIRSIAHEHHANTFPWLRLQDRLEVRTLPVDEDGFFEFGDLEASLDGNTALVAMSHALYNTGSILPLERVGRLLGGQVPFFVDAAQTVGSLGEYDFSRLNSDYMSFNGSKWLCGPMGTGLFYCSRAAAANLQPAHVGGESAILYDSTKIAFKDMPDRFETGFRNFVGLAGLLASLEYLARLGFDNIRQQNIRLCRMLREGLADMPRVNLYGPEEGKRVGIIAFNIEGRDPAYIAERLEERGIVMALREIGETKMVRASPHFYNTEQEISAAIDVIKDLL